MATSITYLTTVGPMANGVASLAGQGPTYNVHVDQNFSITDAYQFDLVTSAGTINIGVGDLFNTANGGPLYATQPTFNTFTNLFVNGKIPQGVLTLNQKVYITNGTNFIFSSLGDPTLWNSDSSFGSGNILYQDNFSSPDSTIALAQYQGYLAVLARYSIEIWKIDADPALYSLVQVLQNIGTVAALSVQSIGELDVMFLSDTGIRSLRVRDSSLNAFVSDIGSPIDSLVQTDLINAPAFSLGSNTVTGLPLACSIVEPAANRYWLYIPGTTYLYVLSYFPALKIQAWSKYSCTYYDPNSHQQVTFTPQKFVIQNGQVYCYATILGPVVGGTQTYVGVVLQYGGSGNNVFDATVASFSSPWLDAKKPATDKVFQSMDAMVQGAWSLQYGFDYIDELESNVNDIPITQGTFDQGAVSIQGHGTHFKFAASTTGNTAAVFSSAIIHYQEGNEK